jgi:phosphoribosylglycinamide formyltransferase-1
MDQQIRLAIFASGSGTNAEQIFRHFKNHGNIHAVVLLSNNSGAFALTRAENYGIKTFVFNRGQFGDGTVLAELRKNGVTHIVLAGFLWLIPPDLLKEYPGKIINIHPSLLPAFGGKGMYGMKVHQAVKTSGTAETGITIHEVNEKYDEGRIIFQKAVGVDDHDDPEAIAAKVHALEHQYFPEVIESWVRNKPYNAV